MARLALSLAAVALIGVAALPAAATITFGYGVTKGKAGSFTFSSIRFANAEDPLDPSYSNVGWTVFSLSGKLTGEIVGDRVELTQHQVLDAKSTKYARNQLGLDDHVFEVRGGELAFSGDGDFLGGYLDYILTDPEADEMFSVGTFYLADESYAGGPANSITPDFLALFANNWNNAGLDTDLFERPYLWLDTPAPWELALGGQPRLALNLGGGADMPEPGSALLFGVGALVVARARRRVR